LEVAHRRDLHLADDFKLRVAVLDLELHVEHADRSGTDNISSGNSETERPHVVSERSVGHLLREGVVDADEREAVLAVRGLEQLDRSTLILWRCERTDHSSIICSL